MAMTMLILGLLLWSVPHLWKRLAPALRSRWGQPGQGLITLLLVLSVILMVCGYRESEGPIWWGATPALKWINNLMVLAAVYLFAAGGMKTRIGLRLHNPQLLGFCLWAAAHLLVNGDLPSFVLFGGLLLWAVLQIALIDLATPDWRPDMAAIRAVPIRKEVMAVVGAVVVFAALGLIHGWIGPDPFGG